MSMESLILSLAKREGSRILDQISGFSSAGMMSEAVREQEERFVHLLGVAAEAFEKHVQDATGESFSDLTDDELGEVGRRLGSAWYEAFSEEDPERLRLLASGVLGVLAIDGKEARSDVWRTVRQLSIDDVRALAEHGYAYLKGKNVGVQKLETDELRDLVDTAVNERLEALRCVRIKQTIATETVKNVRSSNPQPATQTVEVQLLPHGKRVLDALVPYLIKPDNST